MFKHHLLHKKQDLLRQLDEKSEHTGVILTFRTAPFAVEDFRGVHRNLDHFRSQVYGAKGKSDLLDGSIFLACGLVVADTKATGCRMFAEVKVLTFLWRRNIGGLVEKFRTKLGRHGHWRSSRLVWTPSARRRKAHRAADIAADTDEWHQVSIDHEVLTRPVTRAMIEKYGWEPKRSGEEILADLRAAHLRRETAAAA